MYREDIIAVLKITLKSTLLFSQEKMFAHDLIKVKMPVPDADIVAARDVLSPFIGLARSTRKDLRTFYNKSKDLRSTYTSTRP